MGSNRKRKNRQRRDPATPEKKEMVPTVDPDLAGRPTPLHIAHRIIAQFVVIVICAVGGAALTLAGVVFNFKHAQAWTGPIMAGARLLFLSLAWFLLRGAGLRWALRGVVLARNQ